MRSKQTLIANHAYKGKSITPRWADRFDRLLLVINCFFLVVLGLDVSFAREREESHGLQLDGWQGTRPAPQQAPRPSSPQRHLPLQPQVLELPPTRQPSVQTLPQQQTIPSARQRPYGQRPWAWKSPITTHTLPMDATGPWGFVGWRNWTTSYENLTS